MIRLEYFIQVSSYFHFLETIDVSNSCFVFSFSHAFVIFSWANLPQKVYRYPTRGYPTTRLLSSLPYPTRPEVEKSLPVRACLGPAKIPYKTQRPNNRVRNLLLPPQKPQYPPVTSKVTPQVSSAPSKTPGNSADFFGKSCPWRPWRETP